MKKRFVGGLYVLLIFAVIACDEDDLISNGNMTDGSATMSSKHLKSGINLSYIDKSVRPQDDFYSYVNGAWIKKTKIPADRTTIGSFYDLGEKSRKEVKDIITEVSVETNLHTGSDEQKLADLYRSFMDTKTLDKLGLKPIQSELDMIAGLKNKDQLIKYFAHSQMIGGGSPLHFYVDIDAKNSKRYATQIWQSGLSLPDKDYYFNKSKRFVGIRKAFVKHVETMFTLAKFTAPQVSAKQVFAVETAIARYHWSVVDTRDSTKTYNIYQVTELPLLAPDIDWAGYLKVLRADKQADIIINQPSFIKGFDHVLEKYNLDTWKNYMRWQILTHFADKLSAEFEQAHFDFYSTTLNGRAKQPPRWKRGVKTVNSVLGEVVGKFYVKQHFTPDAKKQMQVLVKNLRNAYADSIDHLTWMSDKTKAAAKAKLDKFNAKIGYPTRWKNYDKLIIIPKELVGNIIRANIFEYERTIKKLGEPIHRWEWEMTPQTVNAYYNPTMNEIVFPAAILQPPFFNKNADNAVNYGGIGAIIGHEMGHGFDDQGAKFDGDGNLRDWWTKRDLKEFKVRTKALIKQYDHYAVFDDLNINGHLTLGENIGDLSGLTMAYKAYKMSLHGEQSPVIDGLTGDERFFIGFAQIWRTKEKEKYLRNTVATDPHSPAKFRALGVLSNMPEFYTTFGVKWGDAMYIPPKKRVKIW